MPAVELELELELLDVGGGTGGPIPLLELDCAVTTPVRTVEVEVAEEEDVLGVVTWVIDFTFCSVRGRRPRAAT